MFEFYEFIRKGSHDSATKEGELEFPAGYMFKNVPEVGSRRHGRPRRDVVPRARNATASPRRSSSVEDEVGRRAVRDLPDTFFASIGIDPNEGMDAVRKIDRYADEFELKAVGAFPSGLYPQVALNDKMFYPIYAKCIEVDVAFCSTAGVPGPRLQYAPQEVALIDEVCWFFPELRFVTRHGCEPWTALAAKLLLKWPNLYYSTTAFAPKYYPTDIINFANTRGADKVIFSGYFPAGTDVRPHLPRAARRAVPRARVAEVPARERAVVCSSCRSTHVSREAFEKARADVGVVDTMIGFPAPREEQAKHYDFIRKQTHDSDSQEWEFPAQYMFKGVPHYDRVDDPVDMLVAKMDQHGIRKAITGLPTGGNPKIALERYPDRFFPACNLDPNRAWTQCARSTKQ